MLFRSIDINECNLGSDTCHKNTSQCSNNDGGYSCDCNDGYIAGDDNTCDDIDECLEVESCNSDPNSQCTNNDGSYVCECNDGFNFQNQGSDFQTMECVWSSFHCSTGLNDCDFNASCTQNPPGSESHYECQCNDGYEGDGTTCDEVELVNECETGEHDCDYGSTICEDAVVGYTCK